MIEVLFELVQEVPSFLHLWIAIGVVCRGDALCGGCGKLGRIYRECGARRDHAGVSLGSRGGKDKHSGPIWTWSEFGKRTESNLALVSIDSFRQVSKKSE